MQSPRRRHARARRPARAAVVAALKAAPADAASLFERPLERRTLEELAYDHIRSALVQGRLAPGQRIVAAAVARAAGISRIPVLQALQHEGLQAGAGRVDRRRQAGRARADDYYGVPLGPAEVDSVYARAGVSHGRGDCQAG